MGAAQWLGQPGQLGVIVVGPRPRLNLAPFWKLGAERGTLGSVVVVKGLEQGRAWYAWLRSGSLGAGAELSVVRSEQ